MVFGEYRWFMGPTPLEQCRVLREGFMLHSYQCKDINCRTVACVEMQRLLPGDFNFLISEYKKNRTFKERVDALCLFHARHCDGVYCCDECCEDKRKSGQESKGSSGGVELQQNKGESTSSNSGASTKMIQTFVRDEDICSEPLVTYKPAQDRTARVTPWLMQHSKICRATKCPLIGCSEMKILNKHYKNCTKLNSCNKSKHRHQILLFHAHNCSSDECSDPSCSERRVAERKKIKLAQKRAKSGGSRNKNFGQQKKTAKGGKNIPTPKLPSESALIITTSFTCNGKSRRVYVFEEFHRTDTHERTYTEIGMGMHTFLRFLSHATVCERYYCCKNLRCDAIKVIAKLIKEKFDCHWREMYLQTTFCHAEDCVSDKCGVASCKLLKFILKCDRFRDHPETERSLQMKELVSLLSGHKRVVLLDKKANQITLEPTGSGSDAKWNITVTRSRTNVAPHPQAAPTNPLEAFKTQLAKNLAHTSVCKNANCTVPRCKRYKRCVSRTKTLSTLKPHLARNCITCLEMLKVRGFHANKCPECLPVQRECVKFLRLLKRKRARAEQKRLALRRRFMAKMQRKGSLKKRVASRGHQCADQ